MWDDSKFMAFDVETAGVLREYGLQPHRVSTQEAWLTSYAIATKGKVRGLLAPSCQNLTDLLHFAIKHKVTLVGWNVTFDVAWLCAYGLTDLVMQVSWLDGMLLLRHLEIEPEYDVTNRSKRRSYGLKAAVAEAWPEHAGYGEDIDFGATDPASLAKLLTYNKKDAMFTLALAKRYYQRLEANPAQLRAALLEARSIPLVAQAWYEGILIDQEANATLDEQLVKTAAEALEVLSPHGVTAKIVASPKQLGKLLFEDWGLPVIKQTDGGNDSTDKETLHELAFIDPRAKTLREYREALGNRTKFSVGIAESVVYNGDGRTRPQAAIFGTYSGRMTYYSKQGKNKDERPTGFALHQEKRGKEFRNLLMSPPGYTLCEFDFAGQEFRWMAIASGDETMLHLCEPGEDPHSYMGAQIARSDYKALVAAVHAEDKAAKSKRQLGKVCIAEGELVLTERGLVPIEQVKLADRVWDGVDWVMHTGVVYQGVRNDCITYDDLTATADHIVVLEDGSRVELQEAARRRLQIAHTGNGRYAVPWVDDSERQDREEKQRALRASNMPLREDIVGERKERGQPKVGAVQRVCDDTAPQETRARDHQQCRDGEVTKKVLCDGAALSKHQGRIVQKLRWARNRVSIFFGGRGNRVRTYIAAASDISGTGYRPREEQRSLRAGKFKADNSQPEPAQQERQHYAEVQERGDPCDARIPCAQDTVARSQVQPVDSAASGGSSAASRSDQREVLQSSIRQTKRTYDITNAGPRHRFTVSGCLVHNCNLSLQYRTSAGKLRSVARVQYNLDMLPSEAIMIRDTYLQTYVRVPQYWKMQIAECQGKKYVETFAGRRVQLLEDFNGINGWSLASTAINYRIQGTGADQKYLGLAVLRPYLLKHGVRFAWELHDGIFLYVPDEKVSQCVPEIKQMLDTLPYGRAWGFTPPIPLPVDAKTGRRWGDLKEHVG